MKTIAEWPGFMGLVYLPITVLLKTYFHYIWFLSEKSWMHQCTYIDISDMWTGSCLFERCKPFTISLKLNPLKRYQGRLESVRSNFLRDFTLLILGRDVNFEWPDFYSYYILDVNFHSTLFLTEKKRNKRGSNMIVSVNVKNNVNALKTLGIELMWHNCDKKYFCLELFTNFHSPWKLNIKLKVHLWDVQ